MKEADFSAVAKELMRSLLFSAGSRDDEIGWSQEMIEMWLRCECRCVYCGRSMLDTYIISQFDAERDHLLPESEYPELGNDTSNWVLACHACNKVKRNWDANICSDGKPLYVKGSGKPLSREDQKEFIARVIECNSKYSSAVEQTFAKQRDVLLKALSEPCTEASADIERAKAAHNC